MMNNIFKLFDKSLFDSMLCSELKELIQEHLKECEQCKNGTKKLVDELPILKTIIGEKDNGNDS